MCETVMVLGCGRVKFSDSYLCDYPWYLALCLCAATVPPSLAQLASAWKYRYNEANFTGQLLSKIAVSA